MLRDANMLISTKAKRLANRAVSVVAAFALAATLVPATGLAGGVAAPEAMADSADAATQQEADTPQITSGEYPVGMTAEADAANQDGGDAAGAAGADSAASVDDESVSLGSLSGSAQTQSEVQLGAASSKEGAQQADSQAEGQANVPIMAVTASLSGEASYITYGGLSFKVTDAAAHEVAWVGIASPTAVLSGMLYVPQSIQYGGSTYAVTSVRPSDGATGAAEVTLADDATETARALVLMEAQAKLAQNEDVTSVIIPAGIAYIEGAAFAAYPNATEIRLYGEGERYAVRDGVLYENIQPDGKPALRLLAVPAGRLGKLQLPAETAEIASGALAMAKRTTGVSIAAAPAAAASSTAFSAEGGIAYSADGTTLVASPAGLGATAEVTQGCREVAEGAFAGNADLTSVIVNGDVQKIAIRQADGANKTRCAGAFDAAVMGAKIAIVADDASEQSWRDAGFSNFYGANLIPQKGDTNEPQIGEGLAYRMIDGGLEVWWKGEPGTAPQKLSVPETAEIGGYSYKVVALADDAFKNQTSLEEITIPNGVERLGDGALEGCANLAKVGLPDALITIGARAFAGCTSLQLLALPESLATIGSQVFAGMHDATLALRSGARPSTDVLEGATSVTVYCPTEIQSAWQTACGLLASGNRALDYALEVPSEIIELKVGEQVNLFEHAAINVPEGVELAWLYDDTLVNVDEENGVVTGLRTCTTSSIVGVCIRLAEVDVRLSATGCRVEVLSDDASSTSRDALFSTGCDYVPETTSLYSGMTVSERSSTPSTGFLEMRGNGGSVTKKGNSDWVSADDATPYWYVSGDTSESDQGLSYGKFTTQTGSGATSCLSYEVRGEVMKVFQWYESTGGTAGRNLKLHSLFYPSHEFVGKQFVGWSLSASGGTLLEDGVHYLSGAYTTIYAVWKDLPTTDKNFFLEMRGNGGSVTKKGNSDWVSADDATPYWYVSGDTSESDQGLSYGKFTTQTGSGATSCLSYEVRGEVMKVFQWYKSTNTAGESKFLKLHSLFYPSHEFVGKQFVGWSLSASGGTLLEDGVHYLSGAYTTIYAVWKDLLPDDVDMFKLDQRFYNFNSDAGTDIDSISSVGTAGETTVIFQKLNAGWYSTSSCTHEITASNNAVKVPLLKGYIFQGYYYDSSGRAASTATSGTKVIDSSGKLVSGVSTAIPSYGSQGTLYARWTIVGSPATITLSANGKGTAPTTKLYYWTNVGFTSNNSGYPAPASTVASPTGIAAGYTFRGYNSASNGSGKVCSNGTTIATSSAATSGTWYAQYTPIKYTVTIKGLSTGVNSVSSSVSDISVSYIGGNTSATASVPYASSVSFTVNCLTGYRVKSWGSTPSGISASGNVLSITSMPLNGAEITATVSNQYTVTVTNGSNMGTTKMGSSTSDLKNGTSKTYTYDGNVCIRGTANAGYFMAGVKSKTPSTLSPTVGGATNTGTTSTSTQDVTFKMPASDVTITFNNAVQKTEYTVTLSSEGKSTKAYYWLGKGWLTSSRGSTAATASTFTAGAKTGHTCAGWYDAATGGTKKADNATLPGNPGASGTWYARYSANQHALKIVDTNGHVKTVKSGSTIFGEAAAGTNVAYGTSLTLVVTGETGYKITSVGSTGLSAAASFKSGQSTNSATLKTFTMPDNDVTITLGSAGIQYTVTLNADPGTVGGASSKDITVTFGDKYPALDTPTRAGYAFSGWKLGSATVTGGTSGTTVATASNHTLTAAWTGYTYAITFDGNGETGGSTASVTKNTSNATLRYGDAAKLTSNGFTRTGYHFMGWSYTKTGSVAFANGATLTTLNSSYIPKADNATVTLYAIWAGNEHTLTYDAAAGSVTGDTGKKVTYGSAYGALPTPTPAAGYTFDSWRLGSVSGSAVTATTTVATDSDHKIVAKYTPKTNTKYVTEYYTQNLDGTWARVKSVDGAGTTDTTANADTTVTFEGFTFASSVSGSVLSGNIAGDGSLVLKVYYTRDSHTIIFDAKGGSAVASITKKYGEKVGAPGTTSKTGYTFGGWYEDEAFTKAFTFTDSLTMPARDVSLVAKWNNATDTKYHVAYLPEKLDPAGTWPALDDVKGDASLWVECSGTTGAEVKLTDALKKDIAGFEYDSANANNDQKITIAPDGSAVLKLYYKRVAHKVSFVSSPVGVKDLCTSGWPSDLGSVRYETQTNWPADLADPAGYEFQGWSVSPTSVSATDGTFAMPAEDVTFTAQFKALKDKVTITCKFQGTNKASDTHETVEYEVDSTQTIAAPSHAGYEPDVTTKQVKILASGTAVTFTYTPIDYKVMLANTGGTPQGGEITAHYDSAWADLGEDVLPERERYVFDGYWTTANGDGEQRFDGKGKSLVESSDALNQWLSGTAPTLYARWKPVIRVSVPVSAQFTIMANEDMQEAKCNPVLIHFTNYSDWQLRLGGVSTERIENSIFTADGQKSVSLLLTPGTNYETTIGRVTLPLAGGSAGADALGAFEIGTANGLYAYAGLGIPNDMTVGLPDPDDEQDFVVDGDTYTLTNPFARVRYTVALNEEA